MPQTNAAPSVGDESVPEAIWADGRLGQAYDLIDAVYREQHPEHDSNAMLKKLGEDIEAADIEIGRFK